FVRMVMGQPEPPGNLRRNLRERQTCSISEKIQVPVSCQEGAMAQTSSRFFDEIARLMNDAAGVAQGVRREFDTLFKTQAERILNEVGVVKRDEFEAVKEMA